MQRDFRTTDEFDAVASFFEALFAPGTGHVFAAPAVALTTDGRPDIAGVSFGLTLEDGPPQARRLDLIGENNRISVKGGYPACMDNATRILARFGVQMGLIRSETTVERSIGQVSAGL